LLTGDGKNGKEGKRTRRKSTRYKRVQGRRGLEGFVVVHPRQSTLSFSLSSPFTPAIGILLWDLTGVMVRV